MSKCTQCKWYKSAITNCYGYYGNPDAEVVIMTTANEAEDFDIYIKKFIEQTSYEFEDIGIMNAIRCCQAGYIVPTAKELDACFYFTYKDIQRVNPDLIIAAGESALYQTLGKSKSYGNVGKLLYSKKLECNVIATYELDDFRQVDISEHFKMIDASIGAKADEIKHYYYNYIETVEQFQEIVFVLENAESIFLDLETTGLNPYKDEITLLQLGNEITRFVIEGNILKDIDLSFLKTKPIIGAGFEFDHKFMSIHLGIDFECYGHDVILAEFLLEGGKNNDLSYLVGKYVPESYGYDSEVKEQGGAHLVTDKKQLRQYASDDIGVLPKIRREQYKRMYKRDLLWFFDNIMMPCNRVLTGMSLHGIKYDIEHLKRIDEKYKNRAEKLLLLANEDKGIEACEQHFRKVFNPRSSQMIQWLLLDYYHLPTLKTTKQNNPSIGKDEMKVYAEKYDNYYCKTMEKYRSISNIRDNFLGGVLPKLTNETAHTRYSLHSAASGRPTSYDPNCLNQPRDKEIKKCQKARDKHKYVYSDFAQLEVRIASVVYNEPRLIAICNSDKDMHCAITAQAFGRSYAEIYEGYKAGDEEITELRVKGKGIVFGILYQETEYGLSYSLGISEDEARIFIDDFFRGFPDLKRNIDITKEHLMRDGYLDNYFGFRRNWHFHSEDDHSSLREGVNHMIQSTAWNLAQLAMIDISDKIKDYESELCFQVYDAVIVEAPDNEIDAIASIVKESMESCIKPWDGLNRVRLEADVEVGQNLVDCEKYIFLGG